MNKEQLSLGVDNGAEQYRLTRLQTFNWGTFSGIIDLPIAEAGYLFVGPSGSGKSTLLDAHAALLTPPKWIDFNVAARETERSGKDRSLLSYLRGAWAQQTGETGEHVVQHLRTGSTWSAIAETYRNARRRVVVLAQVAWVRGNSAANADVRRLYLILQRELDLKELAFFAESDFDVRRFKQALPDAFVKDEFGPYQERFRGLLGIDNERALRLLHKTQSAKNLGDLNVFLRDFMLDAPETFGVAERLVSEFGELNAAHQAVVAARRQIETLAPARAEYDELEHTREKKWSIEQLAIAIDAYREQCREKLLRERIERLAVEAAGASEEAMRLAQDAEREFQSLCELRSKRHGMGGGLIEQLEHQREQAERERPNRIRKRDQLAEACRTLGWNVPASAPEFIERIEDAKTRVLEAGAKSLELERRKDEVKEQRRETEKSFQAVCAEVAAMERQRSNIPARMLDIRANLLEALGLGEDALPFVGELLEVKKDAAAWQGAIERVLHGFAQSLLVDDKHYAAVSAYLNERSIGERLVYFRVIRHLDERKQPGPSSLVRKLTIAAGPYAEWLRDELCARFDYECAETLQAFRTAQRAVTREGQVKHNALRHEKDDRRRVDDRSRWVLGFDNKDKLQLYKDRAHELGKKLSQLGDTLTQLADEGTREQQALLHCQTVSNLTFTEVDVPSLLLDIDNLTTRIARETRARPELAQMDAEIGRQTQVHQRAQKVQNAEEVRRQRLEDQRKKHERTLANLAPELLASSLAPAQLSGLRERFAESITPLSLETVDEITRQIERGIRNDLSALELSMTELRHHIEQRFGEFNRSWPAESGGVDPVLASASDYFGKLARLETDGLPRYEERFMRLLREQSDQNLTLLGARLDQERTAIRARLELVNESLRQAEYSPGTHLVIETLDKNLEEVRQFKQSLKQALSHSFSAEPEHAERRFEVLSALVKRLGSQESADRVWQKLVLDVRQHVEFIARELDEDGCEVEIYRSGAGKSGGQRQKLAATCLAAALRYQLGGQDRGLPLFSTVVLDEAFDKADAEFTAMAMNIFETFGFQMIVATPLKSVMTIEPFVGGACYVHIQDRKNSSVLTIDYDETAKRLKLPETTHDTQEIAVS